VRLFTICALACLTTTFTSHAQQPQKPAPVPAPATDAAPSINPDLTDAESSIASSDWKTASTKLDAYLATHANDARALFDAAYVADHQDQLDRAAGFYRRATEANPNSFVSLLGRGLLLARQGKRDEAHS